MSLSRTIIRSGLSTQTNQTKQNILPFEATAQSTIPKVSAIELTVKYCLNTSLGGHKMESFNEDEDADERAEGLDHNAMHAELTSQIVARQRYLKPPAATYEISDLLYEKALKQKDQLTDAERQLLLSRGDLIGRALAKPFPKKKKSFIKS